MLRNINLSAVISKITWIFTSLMLISSLPLISFSYTPKQSYAYDVQQGDTYLPRGSKRTIRKILTDYDYLINVQRFELPSTPDMMMVGKKATNALRRGLVNNIHDNIRNYCARVLYELRDKTAIPELRIALKDRNNGVKRYALKSIGILGDTESIDVVIKMTKDKNHNVRAEAYSTLGKLGEAKGIPYIIKGLKDKSSYVKGRASMALLSIKDLAYEDELVKLLDDESFYVVRNTIEVLSRMQSKKAIKRLLELLEEDSIHYSTYAIGIYKIDKELALKTLIKMLGDPRGYIRLNACWALGRLKIEDAVEPLMNMLSDRNEYVRGNAIIALGKIGTGFSFYDLTKVFPKETPRVRENILKSLSAITKKVDDFQRQQILAFIAKAFDDKNYYVKKRAAIILSKLDYQPAFFDVLKQLNVISNVKYGHHNGLNIIENYSDKNKVLPILKRAFKIHYNNNYQKRKIIKLFSKFNDDEIKSLLKDSYYFGNTYVKRKVVYSFGELGDRSTVPLLNYSLNDADTYIKLNAAYSLYKMGENKGFNFLIDNLFNVSKTLQGNIIYLLKNANIDCSGEIETYMVNESEDIFDRINIAEILLHYNNENALSFLMELLTNNNYYNIMAYDILKQNASDWVVRKLSDYSHSVGDENLSKELSNLILDMKIE